MSRVLPLVLTIVLLLLTACVLMTLAAPAWAAPFDFSADYNWVWDPKGPVLLLAGDAPGVAMNLRPLPVTHQFWPIIHFTLQNDLPPACLGCTLTWRTLADIKGSNCSDGPFACSDARFSLVGEAGGWALAASNDLPVAATPEPATLLLVGTGAAGVGLARWLKRRRAASNTP